MNISLGTESGFNEILKGVNDHKPFKFIGFCFFSYSL